MFYLNVFLHILASVQSWLTFLSYTDARDAIHWLNTLLLSPAAAVATTPKPTLLAELEFDWHVWAECSQCFDGALNGGGSMFTISAEVQYIWHINSKLG